MKITLDIDKDSIVEFLSNGLVKLTQIVYYWFTDEAEILAHILAVLHLTFGFGAVIALIMSYTVYPSFWLQFVLLIFIGFVTIQHVFLQVCIVAVSEISLTKKISPYYVLLERILAHFSIDYNTFITSLITAEILTTLFLFLHLISRLSIHKYNFSY